MLDCDQSEASITRAALVIFLYEEVYLQTRLFVVPVSGSCREAFFEINREEFSLKMKSDCGLIQGKFVNTRVVLL